LRKRPIKIVILTSETPANVWLVNQLLARNDVVGIVIERPPRALNRREKLERRRRMLARYGYARTLNKLLYNWWRSRVRARFEASAARDQFFERGSPVAYSRDMPAVTVANINDAACMQFIRSLAPDLLAVCGTTVIRPEVFTLAPRGAINMHTGITPEFRSADPIFWALYNNEPEMVGVTIHFVDKGIDTGPIICQQRVPVYADDSLATISNRCIRHGAALFVQAIAAIEDGSVRTVDRSAVKGRAFYSIDLGIVQYFLFRMRFRRLRMRLPRAAVDSLTSVTEIRR
jgi:methionyl-tRNA formyltransferase